MAKQAVIFDFGGVLFKTRDYTPRLAWDARLGLDPGTVERIVHGGESWRLAQVGQLRVEDYWADVAAQLDIDAQTAAAALAADFYSGDRLDADLVALVDELRAAGLTVGLLSNDCAALLRPRLEQLAIADKFAPLIISSEIGVMKPHAAAYQAALESINYPADDVIFVDDMPANIEGARQVGLHTVLYQDGMDLRAALEPLLPHP